MYNYTETHHTQVPVTYGLFLKFLAPLGSLLGGSGDLVSR